MLVFSIDRDEIVDACNILRGCLSSRDSKTLYVFATDSYIILSVFKSKVWIQKILLPVRDKKPNNYVGSGELSFDIDRFIKVIKKLPSYTLNFRETNNALDVSYEEERGTYKIDAIETSDFPPSFDSMSKHALLSASFLLDESVDLVCEKIRKICPKKSSLIGLIINEKTSDLIAYDGSESILKMNIVLPHAKIKRHGIFGLEMESIKLKEKFGEAISTLPVFARIYRIGSSLWADDMNFVAINPSDKIDKLNQIRKTFNQIKPAGTTRKHKVVIKKNEMLEKLEEHNGVQTITLEASEDKKLLLYSDAAITKAEAHIGSKNLLNSMSITLPLKYILGVVDTFTGNILNLEIIEQNERHVLYITDNKCAEHLRML